MKNIGHKLVLHHGTLYVPAKFVSFLISNHFSMVVYLAAHALGTSCNPQTIFAGTATSIIFG